jgi:hypothetical protein
MNIMVCAHSKLRISIMDCVRQKVWFQSVLGAGVRDYCPLPLLATTAGAAGTPLNSSNFTTLFEFSIVTQAMYQRAHYVDGLVGTLTILQSPSEVLLNTDMKAKELKVLRCNL